MKVGDTMEKLKIAICDDVPMVTSTLENYLRDYPNCSFECDSFNKSNKLIDAVKTTKYDIFIILKGILGFFNSKIVKFSL